MRVGGVLFYERRALIVAAALAINRPEHIVRRATPIFRSRQVQPLPSSSIVHTRIRARAHTRIYLYTRAQPRAAAKIKIIRK